MAKSGRVVAVAAGGMIVASLALTGCAQNGPAPAPSSTPSNTSSGGATSGPSTAPIPATPVASGTWAWPTSPVPNTPIPTGPQAWTTIAGATPSGPWVATFEHNLYVVDHLTVSKYVSIGHGYWQVWVNEKDTGAYPYLTVNQYTGDSHG